MAAGGYGYALHRRRAADGACRPRWSAAARPGRRDRRRGRARPAARARRRPAARPVPGRPDARRGDRAARADLERSPGWAGDRGLQSPVRAGARRLAAADRASSSGRPGSAIVVAALVAPRAGRGARRAVRAADARGPRRRDRGRAWPASPPAGSRCSRSCCQLASPPGPAAASCASSLTASARRLRARVLAAARGRRRDRRPRAALRAPRSGPPSCVLLPWLIGRPPTPGPAPDLAQRLDGNLAVLLFGLLLIASPPSRPAAWLARRSPQRTAAHSRKGTCTMPQRGATGSCAPCSSRDSACTARRPRGLRQRRRRRRRRPAPASPTRPSRSARTPR